MDTDGASHRFAVPTEIVSSYVELHRRELVAMLEQRATAGTAFARRHAKIMDGVVTSLFQAAYAGYGNGQGVTVVLGAVGGYGRGLLGWKSDLDVRLVTNDEPERVQALAEAVLYPLWDAGISIGHQVSTVTDVVEAARDDLPTATSALDFRVLCGDRAIAESLEERAFAGMFSEAELPGFIDRLQEELDRRHKRFGDSVYLLEPDVKSGAGGLRDLDNALWAARGRFRTTRLDDLRTLGVLSAAEANELKAAKDFLWALRNHLHRRANRRSDRLTFEEQEALTELMGYRPVGEADEEVIGTAVEAFMSDYYRHARVVLRLREQIIARAMPPVHRRRPLIVDLERGIQLFNGQVTVQRAGDIYADPALVFRLFAEAVDRETSLLPFARDLVIRAASKPEFGEALRRSPEAAERFVALVSTSRRSTFRNGSILTELHDTGLLTAMIPEFLPVVGRVHHDVYHVFTVDVHSVAAVDFLRALARGELAGEHPLASSVATNLTRPSVLYLSTLLHDIGKDLGGRDHSQRGADLAADILTRLGLPPNEVDDACNLILQHLVMYRAAARRDLEDPTTISDFAQLVHGREGLRHLFLLTVADLSTTSPTSMTKWKRHMLDDLFRSTDELLSRPFSEEGTEGDAAGDSKRVSSVCAAVRARWVASGGAGFIDEYLSSMPQGYLLSNTPEEIAWHAHVALRAQESVVTAEIVPSSREDVTALCVATGHKVDDPLCVVARDRPGLLASIAAGITANGFDVHAAQVHTRHLSDGRVQAMDLFWVTARERVEDLDEALAKLRRDLERVVTGAVAATDLVRNARRTRFSDRPVPAVTTEVVVDNGVSATHTMIEIATKDRPGLLFTLAKTFHELDLTISVAKINTEGARVLDVFYVTDLNGNKLDGRDHREGVRGALLSALGTPPREPQSIRTGV